MQTEHLLLGLQCHHFQNQEEAEDFKEHPFLLRSVNSDLTGGVLLLQEHAATGREETCDGICWSWSTEICCMGWKLTACQSFEAVPKKNDNARDPERDQERKAPFSFDYIGVSLQHPLLTKPDIVWAGRGAVFIGSIRYHKGNERRVDLELRGNTQIAEIWIMCNTGKMLIEDQEIVWSLNRY